MISERQATAQALRMEGLGNFPLREEAQRELIAAIQRAARDVDHASAITSRWIECNRFAPTPAEIYVLAARCDREYDPREWRCSKCDGTGFVEVYELHTWRSANDKTVEQISHEQFERLLQQVSGIIGEQIVTSAAAHCNACARGRRMAEESRQNEAENAQEKPAARRSTGLNRVQPADFKQAAGKDAE